jgi:hypothetical protein
MWGALYFGAGYFGDLFGLNLGPVAEFATMVVEAETGGFGLGWTAIYEDLADPVVDIGRGFQSDGPGDLVQAPAVCSLTMRNDSHNTGGLVGYYSPDSPNCRPGWATGIRIRVRLRAGVMLRTRFIGFIQKITPTLGLYDDQTVALTAASWLWLASTTPATGITAQINQRGDQLAQTLVTLTQFPPPATSFATGADTYPYALDDLDPATNTLMDGIDSIAVSGLDRFFEKADGTLVYEAYATRRSNPASLFVVTDSPPDGQPGLALAESATITRELASIYNKAQLTGHPKSIDASAVILYSYPISASNPSIANGETAIIRAPYVDPSQLAQQVGGFNMLISDGGAGAVIGTSGSLPTADFKFTSAPSGGGSDVSSQVPVTVVYEARQATLTIGPNASGAIAYYNKLQCRGQGIYDYAQVIGPATNMTSIGQFGGQTLQIDCKYQTSPAFLLTKAQYIVEVYGIGISRFDQGVSFDIPATDYLTLDQLLAREISDPIGITETVSGITAGQYWINGVHETYDERCNLRLTWMLARRFSAPISLAYGAGQTATPWVVPSTVTSIAVKGWGGAGGADGGDGVKAGGGGGFAGATLTVTPGETLLIYIGGGGARSAKGYQGGGGGGYTAIFRGSTALLIAPGGGGGAKDGAGGPGGGTTGVDGSGTGKGLAGTPSAGGAAGANADSADVAATAGASLAGGNGGGWTVGND